MFCVGKDTEAQVLSSFLFQNGKIEKYLQIASVDIKALIEDAILQTVETAWHNPLVFEFFLKPQLAFSLIGDIPVHVLFFPGGLLPHRSNLCSFLK